MHVYLLEGRFPLVRTDQTDRYIGEQNSVVGPIYPVKSFNS